MPAPARLPAVHADRRHGERGGGDLDEGDHRAEQQLRGDPVARGAVILYGGYTD